MKFNPSGSFFVTCSASGVFEVYNTREWTSLFKVPATGRVWDTQPSIPCLAWLDDSRLAILGPEAPNTVVNCWQFDESHITLPFIRFIGHEGIINDIQYDNQSGLLATASDDQSVRLWKTDKPTAYHEFRNHISAVRTVAFQPQMDVESPNRFLASASFDGTVSIYDVTNFVLLHSIGNQIHSFPRDRISCVAWSPDSKYFCTGDLEGVVGVWEWRDSLEPRPFAIWAPDRLPEDQQSLPNGTNGHKDELDRPVHRIHWQKNGQSFAICRENRRVLLTLFSQLTHVLVGFDRLAT
jgi:WD40 repeat protein